MITIEQIKEIKTTLAYAKSVLRQALVDLMFIDEIDLMDIEAMTFEKANDIRKKFARLRMMTGEKMNVFLKCLEKFKL
jgi:DNA helicase TIP49 (TBP-interacting protein)